MLIALIARDKKDALPIRLENRPAHVAYLKASDIVRQAGPLLDEAGEMCGSLVILEVDALAQAQAFVDGDPYGAAGLFESVELIPWNRVIG
ncbi:MAG: YciI family protein [Pelagimonas sp.]|jgi:uncharacterized protein YciI|nr:YciI family protein [Pelagimonas sp.]